MLSTLPAIEELIAIAHRYYPPIDPQQDQEAYFASPEWQRYCDLWERVMRLEEMPRWGEFCDALEKVLPDCKLWDTSVPRRDGCRSLRVIIVPPDTPPGQPEYIEVVAQVSFLAPVYFLYEAYSRRKTDGKYTPSEIRYQFSERTAPHARVLAEHIERYFGCRPLPDEIGRTPVPDIRALGNVPLGQQTLFELLLTEDIL